MGTSAGTTGVGGLPGCVVRPEQTQGPYWVDEKLDRRDIRADTKTGAVKAGVPLTLEFVVSRVSTGGCQPRADVMVDIWHCDALGVYSDATDPGYSTRGQNFLRGYQRTGADGKASFSTIFPGWYAGRAVHVHYRLRTLDASGKVTSDFASQLFFAEAVIDRVHATTPYNSKGRRDTLNATDSIYKNGGSQMLLTTTGSVAGGLHATFDVGLNLG
jgi:protocatechuate 3,4-dioxygenase beta subunit